MTWTIARGRDACRIATMMSLLAAGWPAAMVLTGCGGEPPTSAQPAQPAASSPRAVADKNAADPAPPEKAQGAAGTPAQASPQVVADDSIRTPATVAEAAKAIDLASFPLLKNAKEPGSHTVAQLSYEAPGDVKSAFDFQRKHLVERKWRELPDSQLIDQSASGTFAKDGFSISVSVFQAGTPGHVSVMLQNQGNVNRQKLPLPPGAKLQYDFPGITSFITDGDAKDMAAAVRKLLLEAGWAPYGTAGDTMNFKQNAIQLDARVLAPPGQPGKTVIDFSSVQLSADLPAPPDAENVQFADPLKQLNLDAAGTPVDVAAWYQKALAPAGWKATTEEPLKDGFEHFMIFRNPAKDMLTLTMRDLKEEKKNRITLVEQSAAEVAALEAKAEAQAAAKKKQEDEEKSKPKPKVAVTLPEDADEVKATASEIEFQVAIGKGQATAAALAKQFEGAGWKAEPADGNAMAGRIELKKDKQSIRIDYVDPGMVIPAEITISASGVELQQKGE